MSGCTRSVYGLRGFIRQNEVCCFVSPLNTRSKPYCKPSKVRNGGAVHPVHPARPAPLVCALAARCAHARLRPTGFSAAGVYGLRVGDEEGGSSICKPMGDRGSAEAHGVLNSRVRAGAPRPSNGEHDDQLAYHAADSPEEYRQTGEGCGSVSRQYPEIEEGSARASAQDWPRRSMTARERAMEALRDKPGMSKSELYRIVGGNTGAYRRLIQSMQDRGEISIATENRPSCGKTRVITLGENAPAS